MEKVSSGVFRKVSRGFNSSSSRTVMPAEKSRAMHREVAMRLSVFSVSFAPTAWERRMEMPLDAPMAMALRMRMIGVEFVRAA